MSESIPFPRDPLSYRSLQKEPSHALRPRAGSGTWICTLRILTPLSIQSLFKSLAPNAAPLLPGSSLKGMVRNTVEILGGGCPRFHSGASPRFDICTAERVCLSCRLFGFVDKETAWAGKVFFTDTARLANARWRNCKVPYSRPPAADADDGWIVFDHDPHPRIDPGPVRFLEPEQELRFRVDYRNLDPEELSLLRLALTLTHQGEQYCHKLGFAKSAGFGACTVRIERDSAPPSGKELDRYLAAFRDLGELRQL